MTREEFDRIQEQVLSGDIETELLGLGLLLSAKWFAPLRYKYKNEPIAFWQFRKFEEMCEYVESINKPSKSKDMSNSARKALLKYFLTFIENHL